jgi:hypothetical protein
MDILGERGRNVDEVNRLVTLLIAYREGLKAQTAPDVSALREALESCIAWMVEHGCSHEYAVLKNARALLRSEPKLGGTV